MYVIHLMKILLIGSGLQYKRRVSILNKNDDIIQHKQIDIANLSDIEKEIVSIIDQYIQPAVAADGGSIVFKSYNDGIVHVILKGACSGCPSSTITLKQGIENLLKQKLGSQIKEVTAYNG